MSVDVTVAPINACNPSR